MKLASLSMNESERVIQEATALVDHATWRSTHDQDYSAELEMCRKAKKALEQLSGLNPELEKLRRKTLSQCLLVIDNALVGLGRNDGSVDRATEALNLAETSGSDVQVARALLALGNAFLSSGDIEHAEQSWVRLLLLAEACPDDSSMNQVVGWTLITRGHVLNARSLYDQAVRVLEDADSTLESIGDNFGVSTANDLLSNVYSKLGDEENSEQCSLKADEFRRRLRKEPNPFSS
jgi:tetratricopeptide (TPR) repeat protein